MTRKIITRYDPPPIPIRAFDWSAVLEDYDGADDSSTRHQIGYGRTEEEARGDLKLLLDEAAGDDDDRRDQEWDERQNP